jgi:hypothetical protein
VSDPHTISVEQILIRSADGVTRGCIGIQDGGIGLTIASASGPKDRLRLIVNDDESTLVLRGPDGSGLVSVEVDRKGSRIVMWSSDDPNAHRVLIEGTEEAGSLTLNRGGVVTDSGASIKTMSTYLRADKNGLHTFP